MRTTIELPDELLSRAKIRAAQERISLKDFFITAIEQRLRKTRRLPPTLGSPTAARIGVLTPEQIDEGMFG